MKANAIVYKGTYYVFPEANVVPRPEVNARSIYLSTATLLKLWADKLTVPCEDAGDAVNKVFMDRVSRY